MSKNSYADSYPNILSQGVRITGEIHFDEDVYIDGSVEGNLKVSGSLVLGEHGSVGANVEAKNMVVQGKIKGKIQCEGVLKITASATIEGDIHTTLLSVEEGAVLHGKIIMHKAAEQLGLTAELPNEGA